MTTTAAGLKVDYLPLAKFAAYPAAWWEDVLGIVSFENSAALARSLDVPVAASRTPVLGSSADLCEVWRVARHPVASEHHEPAGTTCTAQAGRVIYRQNGNLLFGQIAMPEDALDEHASRESSRLRLATEIAYQEIFNTLKVARYPHLVRVWNYLPEINVEDRGTERYRQFNSARRAAFTDDGRTTEGGVPAASALGSSSGGPLSIYFLAARELPTMIENPRQVSAYHYPLEYGTHSPTFSRGCILHCLQGATLFVSGTASIVGHRTMHPGDVALQTRESIANIEALLREANRVAAPARYTLQQLKYKVYVRRPADLALVAAELGAKLGAETCVVYLKADVCREDLLVEIEATGECALSLSN